MSGKLQQVQRSFVKDVVYGAVALLLFSSMGMPQWQLAAIHVASVPGVFLPELPDTALVADAFAALSVVALLADLVQALTLACAFSQCCSDGRDSPPFAPTVRTCGAGAIHPGGALLAGVALATAATGGAFSALRALACFQLKRAQRSSALPVAVLYLAVRVYELTWVASQPMWTALALWLAAAMPMIAFLTLSAALSQKGFVWIAPAISAVLDALAAGLAFSDQMPGSPAVATGLVQLVQAALAAWIALESGRGPRPVGESEEEDDDDDSLDSATVGAKGGSMRQRQRKLGMKL